MTGRAAGVLHAAPPQAAADDDRDHAGDQSGDDELGGVRAPLRKDGDGPADAGGGQFAGVDAAADPEADRDRGGGGGQRRDGGRRDARPAGGDGQAEGEHDRAGNGGLLGPLGRPRDGRVLRGRVPPGTHEPGRHEGRGPGGEVERQGRGRRPAAERGHHGGQPGQHRKGESPADGREQHPPAGRRPRDRQPAAGDGRPDDAGRGGGRVDRAAGDRQRHSRQSRPADEPRGRRHDRLCNGAAEAATPGVLAARQAAAEQHRPGEQAAGRRRGERAVGRRGQGRGQVGGHRLSLSKRSGSARHRSARERPPGGSGAVPSRIGRPKAVRPPKAAVRRGTGRGGCRS